MDRAGWARIIKEAATDSRYQPKVDIRHPMFEMSDKIGDLRISVGREPTMRADRALGGLLRELRQAWDAVHEHLNAHYRWD